MSSSACAASWTNLAITLTVADYNGFNLEKDFPAVYR